jgi:hypothetical protein
MVINERKGSLALLILLVTLVFVYHFGVVIYQARGLEPLPAFEFLYNAAFLCGVVWWLKAESRSSAVKQVYCPGLIVGIGWPIIIPYHLLKTRGVRGLIPLLALIGSFLAAYILGVLVYITFWN